MPLYIIIIPLVPKKKMDSDKLEEMISDMRSRVKYNCLTCMKYLPREQAVEEHKNQAKITFVGKRQRMQLLPTTCEVKKEKVYSEEDIQQRIREES